MKNSNRYYTILMVENNGASRHSDFHISELLSTDKPDANQYEFVYAMQEHTDAILDLRKGDSMYFQPNRDDKDSKGIILRDK